MVNQNYFAQKKEMRYAIVFLLFFIQNNCKETSTYTVCSNDHVKRKQTGCTTALFEQKILTEIIFFMHMVARLSILVKALGRKCINL